MVSVQFTDGDQTLEKKRGDSVGLSINGIGFLTYAHLYRADTHRVKNGNELVQ